MLCETLIAFNLPKRTAIVTGAAPLLATPSPGQDRMQPRLSSPSVENDNRAVALMEELGPAVSEFASFEPHWNGTPFGQGNEPEAVVRGNLELAITSAQELAVFFPEFSIFTAGYVHQDAGQQKAVLTIR